MKELFLAISTKLMAAGLGIKWMDVYNRQFENLELDRNNDSTIVPLPAVLVEMSVDKWDGQSKGIQIGECIVTLHIGQDLYEDTYDGSPDQIKALSNIFDLPEAIYLQLQGFKGATFSGLERTKHIPDTSFTNLNVQQVIFKTTLSDPSKARADEAKLKKLTPDLKLSKNVIPDSIYPQQPVTP
ncbi:hypothetical protein QNI19_14540 [Cytophagaceae bacterium DM2B3-1]|uniref:Uncharacterized protein n=1 Tax=Xanthocytophaga flava TaxID=3048013 RepID=A0ABT7CK98_9BACT|nr:hypothetical protein [Xanthocytophaga flavus]MDJ1494159.1 hypothetical protein [Xanthocytophaga flavus]